jgi:hypothetical protein
MREVVDIGLKRLQMLCEGDPYRQAAFQTYIVLLSARYEGESLGDSSTSLAARDPEIVAAQAEVIRRLASSYEV